MKLFKNCIFIIFIVNIYGCTPSYMVPNGAPSAIVNFDISNDSEWATGRHVEIMTYPSLDCNSGETKIDSESFMGDSSIFENIPVIAEAPFVYEIRYRESRFGHLRECNARSLFVPKTNRKYNISFQAINDSDNCSSVVYEHNLNGKFKVNTKNPMFACKLFGTAGLLFDNSRKIKNGQGGWTNVEVKVYH